MLLLEIDKLKKSMVVALKRGGLEAVIKIEKNYF